MLIFSFDPCAFQKKRGICAWTKSRWREATFFGGNVKFPLLLKQVHSHAKTTCTKGFKDWVKALLWCQTFFHNIDVLLWVWHVSLPHDKFTWLIVCFIMFSGYAIEKKLKSHLLFFGPLWIWSRYYFIYVNDSINRNQNMK